MALCWHLDVSSTLFQLFKEIENIVNNYGKLASGTLQKAENVANSTNHKPVYKCCPSNHWVDVL